MLVKYETDFLTIRNTPYCIAKFMPYCSCHIARIVIYCHTGSDAMYREFMLRSAVNTEDDDDSTLTIAAAGEVSTDQPSLPPVAATAAAPRYHPFHDTIGCAFYSA